MKMTMKMMTINQFKRDEDEDEDEDENDQPIQER
jgi:hypothetical protein